MTSCSALRILAPFCLLSFAGCAALTEFNDVEIARSAMLGFTEQDVRMCAGFPSRTAEEGDMTIWSYEIDNRSAGVSLSAPILFGAASTNLSLPSTGTCRAQFRFVDGRVDRVSYAGNNDTARGRDTLCTPVIKGCVAYAKRFGKGKLPPPPAEADPAQVQPVKP
ncbi:hypothetical protein [Aureimonas psammosilenae]|uniref:hypothetical protein n=1 Tax=Aureimonas psammosilenae TaxID=2495496 RepID=UPI0012609284|nr:hypothetical protein [Aureimonas psammosilenae]